MKRILPFMFDNFTLPPSAISVTALVLATRFGEWTLYTERERFFLTLQAALFITVAHLMIDCISLLPSWKKNNRRQQQRTEQPAHPETADDPQEPFQPENSAP